MSGTHLVAEGGRRLLAALEGLAHGSVTLTVHIRDGRPCRAIIVREESLQPEAPVAAHDGAPK